MKLEREIIETKVKCVGIEYLNNCEYAGMAPTGFYCSFKDSCEYQRPRIINCSVERRKEKQ